MRLECFPGQAERVFYRQCREAQRLRPLLTVVILAVGVSSTVSGFYGFIADRSHSIAYIS